MRIHLLLLLASTCLWGQAQNPAKNLVQFSGVVVTGDSLEPVPFTSIHVANTFHGTMSDVYGYFSFVAREGDTLVFKAVGFQPSGFAIPDSLTENKYSIIQTLFSDTIQLKELVVYPWPSKEQFREAFLALRLDANDEQRALDNLSPARRLELMENMPTDGYNSYRYAMNAQQTSIYNTGGYPTINLLNPIAWAQFVQAWKSGKLKRQ
jgi:CarboxypepD_reg-like domain